MFKSALIYQLPASFTFSAEATERALQKARFAACSPDQKAAMGWIEPRGKAHGAMVEMVGGEAMMQLQIEDRTVPKKAIKRRAGEIIAEMERTGLKPGKKQIKEIEEGVELGLQRHVISKFSTVSAWISPAGRLLVVDATSTSKADIIITEIVKAVPGFSVSALETQVPVASTMTGWLLDQPSGNFDVGRECELASEGEGTEAGQKSAVRYKDHSLNIVEIRGHLEAGKVPKCLAMTWEGRVSFTLTDQIGLRKIQFLEGVTSKAADEDAFDADVAIMTGELRGLIRDLFGEIGVNPPN